MGTDPDRRDALGPLGAAALWGGMYVVSKWGFSAIPPATLAFLRVGIGALTLYVIVRFTVGPRSFSRTDRRSFVALGFWVALTLVTQFVGTDLTNASQGSLLTVLTPVFTLLLGIAILDESLSGRKLGGMALAAVGTLLVATGQYDLARIGMGNALGLLALLVASFGWAAYTVYGAPLVRKYSALETATYSTIAAVPMLAVAAGVELWALGRSPLSLPVTPAVVGAVLYLGVASTALAWYLWYRGVRSLEAGVVAVFFFVQPIVGSLLGGYLLGESLGPLFVLGGAVMAVGVWLSSTAGENP
ncbi:MAG: DMT family transporter [Halanaeroarchaeum sp.]